MRKMAIEALYQKPRLSKPHPGHTIYPYLLKGVTITEANEARASDITYIPMANGFCYLVAIIKESTLLAAIEYSGYLILH
jgi:putative transposase